MEWGVCSRQVAPLIPKAEAERVAYTVTGRTTASGLPARAGPAPGGVDQSRSSLQAAAHSGQACAPAGDKRRGRWGGASGILSTWGAQQEQEEIFPSKSLGAEKNRA